MAASGRWRWWLLATVGVLVVTLAGLGLAWRAGVVHLSDPSPGRYPVRGVDVSHYQGTIDWPVLAAQGIDFSYVKGTEGSGSVDPMFEVNLAGSMRAGLRTGVYHFFSFESPGASQAANVIARVPADPGQLPIAVDAEFYGDFWTNHPPVEVVRRELAELIARLDQHYPTPVIIYTTLAFYDRYLAGQFPGVEVWIRDVWREPTLSDGRAWTFWQYSDRHTLPGYVGDEPRIDLNVFAGTREDWNQYRR